MEWGGIITSMFLCTHTGTATSSSFLLSRRHRHCSFIISYRWGGVGWHNIVHVPVHTQARQPHHLSCCPADAGTALSSSVTGGVGWDNNVHVPIHTQARQTHHLSCCPTDTGTALSSSVTGGVGWGWVGWGGIITFMFL